ncbi:hypothetical protein P9265_14320 [Schinkia azotoformans]|uniref:hypothetical protein n=1 Tax=Schinkia azotoformans TaxID=1454 RepID=UPI002E1C39F8|nr:hypothetical protein [Schinkia azotoformans]
MRKLLFTLLVLFITYVIYYDLSAGVLSKPTSIVLLQNKESKQSENATAKELTVEKANEQEQKSVNTGKEEELYYQEVKVAAGQTVLSIVEQIQDGPLPVSISQLITDFQLLNPKTEPEMIQIGKVYKFPVYTDKE